MTLGPPDFMRQLNVPLFVIAPFKKLRAGPDETSMASLADRKPVAKNV
jgi:hypothetical protein